MSNHKIRTLIVEDQRMPRENMEYILSSSDRYECVSSISGADLALAVCHREKIDLILMDVITNGIKNGIEATEEIKKQYPTIKIIIITSMAEVSYLENARKAGADSFWYKDISRESLMEIMDRTMAGEKIYPEKTPTVKIGNISSDALTASEIKVLRLVCEGLEYTEIALKLGISVRTVKYHISNLLMKTGYANKTRMAIAVTNSKFIIPTLDEEDDV